MTPQTRCCCISITQNSRRCPSRSSDSRRYCWGCNKIDSGHAMISATSRGSACNCGQVAVHPTTGVISTPDATSTCGKRPSTCTAPGSRPVSSCASRSAVASTLASCAATRPPGRLIWPGCVGRSALRRVRMVCGRGAALINNSTAACGTLDCGRAGSGGSSSGVRASGASFTAPRQRLLMSMEILSSVSWYSSGPCESATMPPPPQQWICPPSFTSVRMQMLLSISPLKSIQPMAPQ